MSAHYVGASHLDALAAFASNPALHVSAPVAALPGLGLAPGADRLPWLVEWLREAVPGRYRLPLTCRAPEVWAVLHWENVRSLRALYPDSWESMVGGPEEGGDRYCPPSVQLSPVQVLAACAGYEYQSCESDEWPGSLARAMVEGIRAAAIRAVTRDVIGREVHPEHVHPMGRGTVRSLSDEMRLPELYGAPASPRARKGRRGVRGVLE